MYHAGHQGIALLIYAPLAYGMLIGGYPLLALLGLGLMISLASFPDIDMRIGFLTHRGFTHTFLFAIIVGGVLAGIAFLFGDLVIVEGVERLLSIDALPSTLTTTLESNSATITQRYGGAPLATFVFFIGVLGICSHLLGDVLTPMGIEPLWPISRTNISLSITPAKSTIANSFFLVIGWAAVFAAAIFGTGLLGEWIP